MHRFVHVTGLCAGLAVLISTGTLTAQVKLPNAPPPQAPLINNPLTQQQKIIGFNVNPGGAAPLIGNGTNVLGGNTVNNATNLTNLNSMYPNALNALNTLNPNALNALNQLTPTALNALGQLGLGGNTAGVAPGGLNPVYGNPYLGMNPAAVNPYLGLSANGNPFWFWGTGMPTGNYNSLYPTNPYNYQYALNSYFLTNPYLNSLSNPAMSYPFPAGVMNAAGALNQMGIGNILSGFPMLPNGQQQPGQQPGQQQFP